MLVTVLVIAGIGLLFGAGALLLFRYQCQMRIDRQHELEKVYAVRSVLNYARTKDDIPVAGKTFQYHTGSGRDLKLVAKPVEAIFPTNSVAHLFMTNKNDTLSGGFVVPCLEQYSIERDYEYGAAGVAENYDVTGSMTGNIAAENETLKSYGLAFMDTAETNNVRWWVNIGMPGTGGWQQDNYGRRYWFYRKNYIGSAETGAMGDIVRLCLIRNVENALKPPGQRHGWPLSEGERALVLEIRARNVGSSGVTDMRFSEFRWTAGGVVSENQHVWQFNDTLCYMGIQLAQRNVSVFYISTSGGGDPWTRPYTFLGEDSVEMTKDTYDYFAEGSVVDADGKITQAPELRAVFEVEAASNLRNGTQRTDFERLTDFKVTPAYQYDIFLEHPASVVNRATVAQRVVAGEYDRKGTSNTIRTYDTHGTDNKGFRKDEKDFEESRRKKGH